MRGAEPNTLFVYVNGKIVGRFQFRSKAKQTLASAGIFDVFQRPWISGDHKAGTYSVDTFASENANMNAHPIYTYQDRDGDGMIDRKMDWQRKQWLMLSDEPAWVPVESEPIQFTP